MVDRSGWIHVKILLIPCRTVRRSQWLGSWIFTSAFFSSRSMRTLFLTDNKAKHWPWRIMLMCGLVAVLMVGVYFSIDDSIGEGESAVVLLCVALFGGVVALAYRRVQVRRLQCTVRDLKDSALW